MKALNQYLASGLSAFMMLFLTVSCSDDEIDDPVILTDRPATILAVNDLHANLDNFPRFAYVVDSLRNIYPDLILVSAGDNQTGHPANDQYDPKGLPIIELMNAVHFDLSALGNHEFDTGQEGFAFLTQEADFDFLCSNIDTPKEYPFDIKPHKVIHTKNDLTIGIASLLQVGSNGIPACRPEYTEGFTFHDPFQVANQYAGMKDSCDIVVFVNHLGYTDDVALAEQYPAGKLDVIVGGHSHTLLDHEEVHNGVLITQAEDKLEYASLVEMNVKPDGKVEAHMKLISVGQEGNKDPEIERMVHQYLDNPAMKEPIATLEAPITSKEQMGYLMADALRHAEKVDCSLVNGGGVRTSSWDMEVITPYDVYALDPFGNTAITVNFTGAELREFFKAGFYESKYHWIYPSGIKAEYTVKNDDLVDVRLFTLENKPLDNDKVYKVSMNNYMISAIKIPHQDKEVNTYIPTAENMIEYLREIQVVKSYQEEHRIKIIEQ